MINDKGISHEVFHINCHFYVYIIFCRSAGAERPDSCGDDSDVHQQGGERTEESGESDAATIHRPYLDQEEVEATTDLQREFNNYLDSFRSIVSYAAQIYGFYHEIGQLVDNMGGLVAQLDAHPANGLAVALSAKRNKIYRELIMNSIEIVNDIRTVCLSGNKMTEKERVEIVFGIRPKLKKMNKQLKRLTRAVKYTTMGDVWMEIDEGARPTKANKAEIAAAAKRRWKQVGKNVN